MVTSVYKRLTLCPVPAGPASTVTLSALLTAGGMGRLLSVGVLATLFSAGADPPPPQAVTLVTTRASHAARHNNLLKYIFDIDTGRDQVRRIGVSKKVAHAPVGPDNQSFAFNAHW